MSNYIDTFVNRHLYGTNIQSREIERLLKVAEQSQMFALLLCFEPTHLSKGNFIIDNYSANSRSTHKSFSRISNWHPWRMWHVSVLTKLCCSVRSRKAFIVSSLLSATRMSAK